jgi:hypothetical protein
MSPNELRRCLDPQPFGRIDVPIDVLSDPASQRLPSLPLRQELKIEHSLRRSRKEVAACQIFCLTIARIPNGKVRLTGTSSGDCVVCSRARFGNLRILLGEHA